MAQLDSDLGENGRAPTGSPSVTVAVPMLNELGAIEHCLDSFEAQDYPTDLMEVLVIDGGSTDGSREYVEERATTQPWIRVVDNPVGSAAAAFNIGTFDGRGDIVFLFSSHGVPESDFVSRSVKVLLETGATGVGGRYLHIGTDPKSTAIGAAMVSPFGMASAHRFATERQDVDTISHPGYWRQALVDVGGFDESLARNSDYEINIRLRQAGHRLVFDPSIESIYRPRPNLERLAKQFWHYGRWKAHVARQHPADVKARHLVAPAFAAFVASMPILAAFGPSRKILAGTALTYGALTAAATQKAASGHPAPVSKPTLAAAFPTMHLSWGFGVLTSVAQFLRPRSRTRKGRS